MGMDYSYARSSSYPRFDRELCAIAEIFGGIKTDNLKQKEEIEFDNSDLPKFVFPNGLSDVLIKWFNNIYDVFTAEETENIWNYILRHPEIQEISSQIWSELETLVECGEGWGIS